ncbi:hypothetical protein M747DRAFT_351024 [Aspergillus niger ATCC 13496]|uniref:Contig An17c0030, genomic contig n=3 Tax=Aspergillus niger TaxID=5061 RepID=A2R996_ASPNC|nr:uncharacterized protein An17g00590 [Aspergillus niger]RDH20547.1 hypothetical protein M747DRAFT_351024 [Aspergillus niger ATCC 13496]CAK42987.1 unnamed protein product [Aspergillus niger]
MLSRSLGKGTSFTGQQTTVLGIGVAFMAFTSVVIALRVYVRTLLLRAWGADDGEPTIVPRSFDKSNEHAVLMVIGTLHTMGLENTCIWATRLLYVLGLCFIKLSLLWFYLRLETRRFMQWLVYSVIFIVLGVSISSFFVDTLSCIPPSKFWNSTKSGHCMSTASQQKFYEVNGILVIVMDILIWAVPIPMLWRVRISLRKKIAVLGVFSVGLLSIAAACVRYNTVLQLANNPDETYVLAASLNWCGIEAYVAIFCGSTPALYVFVKRYLPQILGPSYAHNPTYPGQSNAKRFSAPFCRVSRQDVSESRLGESQDALHDGDGIMLKTDIHWEVTDIDAEGRVDSHHSRLPSCISAVCPTERCRIIFPNYYRFTVLSTLICKYQTHYYLTPNIPTASDPSGYTKFEACYHNRSSPTNSRHSGIPAITMNSFFHSTKHAKTSYYHIPSTVNLDDVQQILHNHSTLANIFWPQTVNDPENLIFENQTGPSTTEIQIGPASGSNPGPSATKCKARMISHHEAREVVVEEEMPLGLRMTLVYRVSDEPPQGISAEEGDGLLALADSQPSTSLSPSGSRIGLYLEVERSVMAPRPLSMLVKTTEGPVVKTKNLLFVLDELGNGRDLDAVLGALNDGLGESDDEGEGVLEKYKAD